MKVKIIGYERNKGFSNKKNCNYDYHILHVQMLTPFTKPGCYGSEVKTFPIAEVDGIIKNPPMPGEIWEISFNYNRRIDSVYLLED